MESVNGFARPPVSYPARIQFVRVFPVVHHCGLAVVGHEHLLDSAEKLEHVDVCVVP